MGGRWEGGDWGCYAALSHSLPANRPTPHLQVKNLNATNAMHCNEGSNETQRCTERLIATDRPTPLQFGKKRKCNSEAGHE